MEKFPSWRDFQSTIRWNLEHWASFIHCSEGVILHNHEGKASNMEIFITKFQITIWIEQLLEL